MSPDHGKLLSNTICWALNEDPIVTVKAPGLVETTVWRQERSMTVHLVNLTNPMMLKGPFRELIPVAATVGIKLPVNAKIGEVKLLMSGQQAVHTTKNGVLTLTVPQIFDHEIIAVDLV